MSARPALRLVRQSEEIEGAAVTVIEGEPASPLFTQVPDAFYTAYGFAGAAILARIIRFANGPKGYCDAGADVIAGELGCDVATVKRWRKQFLELGVLVEVGRSGRAPRLVFAGVIVTPKRAESTVQQSGETRRKHRSTAQKAPFNGAESTAKISGDHNTTLEANASPAADAGGLPETPAEEFVTDTSSVGRAVGSSGSGAAKAPRAKRDKKPDEWAPLNEAFRLMFGLSPVVGTWKLAASVKATMREHGISPEDAPRVLSVWEQSERAADRWQYVEAHSAGRKLAKWIKDRRQRNTETTMVGEKAWF